MEGLMKTNLILKSYEDISCIMLHQGLGWFMKSGEQGERVPDFSFLNSSGIFNGI